MATNTDIEQMGEELRLHGGEVSILTSSAQDASNKNGHTDPHLSDPITNPSLQDKIHRTLFG